MRFSTLTAAFLLLSLTMSGAAFAQEVSTCSSRLPPLERAKCLVEWHKQVMAQLGRSSAPANAGAVSSGASSPASAIVISVGSSGSVMLSCSRAFGAVRAACLVQQRKDTLKKLAGRKYVPPPPPAPVKPRSCARYTDGATRMRCLGGGQIILSSSSSAAGGSGAMSSTSSTSSMSSASSGIQ